MRTQGQNMLFRAGSEAVTSLPSMGLSQSTTRDVQQGIFSRSNVLPAVPVIQDLAPLSLYSLVYRYDVIDDQVFIPSRYVFISPLLLLLSLT